MLTRSSLVTIPKAGLLAIAVWGGQALLASPAAAKSETVGTTSLRLHGFDVSGSPKGEFVFYTSFLDEYFKPIRVTDPKQWSITFDGAPVEGEWTVKPITQTDRGISIVAVAAADNIFEEDGLYKHASQGIGQLLNGLRAQDKSAVVIAAENVQATNSLSPSHGDAVTWLNERKPGGLSPPLLDAIDKALRFFPDDLDTLDFNRALVVISDGGDKYVGVKKEFKRRINSVQRKAEKHRVRVHVIAVVLDDALEQAGVKGLEGLARATRGTYRVARTAREIEQKLGDVRDELTGQHVITLHTTDFEGEKEITFGLAVKHENRTYPSNSEIAFVAPAESDLLMYILAGAGGLVGLLLLIFIVRLIARAVGNRSAAEEVDEGPETVACAQCGNAISPDWLTCRYCEALPHHGRLTVRSVGALNGRTWFIKDTLTNIGSGEGSTILIPDASVSKRHAGIKVLEGNKFELVDFASTNGVMVNDQRVTKQFLRNDDVIQMGTVVLHFALKK